MEQLIETKVYGVRLKDRSVLLKSSSGGAFTAISDVFLQNGDAVVCGVYDYDAHDVKYRLLTTIEERDRARGSKYMQSRPGNVYRDAVAWLRANPEKNLLFVGMGCQAEGFRKYSDAVGLRDRVTVADIICHGSPSPKIWREYAKGLESTGKISYLTFKDKRKGWLHPTAVAVVDGKEVPLYKYVKIFYNKCALRPSCHVCPFATTERRTDMTIGDFWHIEEKMPDFYDKMGTSLVLIHTEKGVRLFECIKESVEYRESNIADCWQANLESPTPMSPHRQEFWQDYYRFGIEYIMKNYGRDPMITRVKKKLIRIYRGGGNTK